MANIIIAGAEGKRNCPLCFDKFEHVHYPTVDAKGVITIREYLGCRKCKIVIAANDPLLGLWNSKEVKLKEFDNEEQLICVRCGNEMRFFCRSDSYMKAFCPRCKCSYETKDEINPNQGLVFEPEEKKKG